MSGATAKTFHPVAGMPAEQQNALAVGAGRIAARLINSDIFQDEWTAARAARDQDAIDLFLVRSVAVRLAAETVDQAIAKVKAAPKNPPRAGTAGQSQAGARGPALIMGRFELDPASIVAADWILLDVEDDFAPVTVPRLFAKTPEAAAAIADWLLDHTSAAWGQGAKDGYSDAQADFRRMIGAEAAT